MDLNELVTKTDLQALEERLAQRMATLIPEGFVPGKQWLRSREVVKWLGISTSTLQNLRDRGDIPFTQIGETYFYPYQQIKAMMENRSPDGPKRI